MEGEGQAECRVHSPPLPTFLMPVRLKSLGALAPQGELTRPSPWGGLEFQSHLYWSWSLLGLVVVKSTLVQGRFYYRTSESYCSRSLGKNWGL